MYDEKYFLEFGFKEDNIGTVARNIQYFWNAKHGFVCPCGYGQIVDFCNGYFVGDFRGIDFSKFLISKRNQGNVSFGDIRKLDCDGEKFDLFVCCDLLEHFNEKDIDISLKEIERTTSIGSYLIMRVCIGFDSVFRLDETHITSQDDRWWISKIESITSFRLYSLSGVVGEFVFVKNPEFCPSYDFFNKKYILERDFFVSNNRLNIELSKDREFFFYQRKDKRFACEIICKKKFFRRYVISLCIPDKCVGFEIFYNDDAGVLVVDRESKETLLLNMMRVF